MTNICVFVPRRTKTKKGKKLKTFPNKTKNPYPRTAAQACYATALGIVGGSKWKTQKEMKNHKE